MRSSRSSNGERKRDSSARFATSGSSCVAHQYTSAWFSSLLFLRIEFTVADWLNCDGSSIPMCSRALNVAMPSQRPPASALFHSMSFWVVMGRAVHVFSSPLRHTELWPKRSMRVWMVMFSSAFCDLPQLAKEKSSFENVKPLSMQKFPCPNRGTGASVQLLATRSTRELKSVVC